MKRSPLPPYHSRLAKSGPSIGRRISGTSPPQPLCSRVCLAGLLTSASLTCAAQTSVTNTAAVIPVPSVTNAPAYTYPPPQPNALAWRPYPGLLNTWLRQQSPEFNKWNIGAWERFRYESRNYFAANGAGPLAVDFNAASPTAHNNYSLFRTQVWVGYAPTEWIRGFVEAQDSSQNGWEGDPNPQANNALGFYQYYAVLGNLKEFPLTFQAGRQELSYGEERLIGSFIWDNIGRVFDAARLHYVQDKFWVDAFAGSLVLPVNRGTDIVNWDEVFWGIYGHSKGIIPKGIAEFYFLGNNANNNSPNHVGTVQRGNSPRDIYTIGTHLKSAPGGIHGWDYDVEVDGQFGQYQYPKGTPVVVNGQKLDHLAYAVHLEGGYSFTNAWARPRVGLFYNQASGDHNPGDDRHTTFVNLYPTNHKFYGFMDFLSWQNLRQVAVTTTWYPVGKLRATLNFYVDWLLTTEDFSYNVGQGARTTGGYGLNPGNQAHFGQELDLILNYPVLKWMNVEAGYGHFFTGQYVQESLENTGGAHDANWYYLQLIGSF